MCEDIISRHKGYIEKVSLELTNQFVTSHYIANIFQRVSPDKRAECLKQWQIQQWIRSFLEYCLTLYSRYASCNTCLLYLMQNISVQMNHNLWYGIFRIRNAWNMSDSWYELNVIFFQGSYVLKRSKFLYLACSQLNQHKPHSKNAITVTEWIIDNDNEVILTS